MNTLQKLQELQLIDYQPYRQYCIILHNTGPTRIFLLTKLLYCRSKAAGFKPLDVFTKAKICDSLSTEYMVDEQYKDALFFMARALSVSNKIYYINLEKILKLVDQIPKLLYIDVVKSVICRCVGGGMTRAALITLETYYRVYDKPCEKFWKELNSAMSLKCLVPDLFNYKFIFNDADVTRDYTFSQWFARTLYKVRNQKMKVMEQLPCSAYAAHRSMHEHEIDDTPQY